MLPENFLLVFEVRILNFSTIFCKNYSTVYLHILAKEKPDQQSLMTPDPAPVLD